MEAVHPQGGAKMGVPKGPEFRIVPCHEELQKLMERDGPVFSWKQSCSTADKFSIFPISRLNQGEFPYSLAL